jgi:hypothetical protein
MKNPMFALAAASVLPFLSVASAQVPAAVDLDTVAPVNGSWTYRAIEGGSEADFIDAAAAVRLKIRCERAARKVSIVRTDVPAATATLTIWTSTASRSVPARFLPTKDLVADLSATDSLLDSVAFSRGRLATAAQGAPMVAVPAWPEIDRVIEDCRS